MQLSVFQSTEAIKNLEVKMLLICPNKTQAVQARGQGRDLQILEGMHWLPEGGYSDRSWENPDLESCAEGGTPHIYITRKNVRGFSSGWYS
jgi:hypothetical protein